MEIEKWMCNKCGFECRVEIDFHKIENYEDGHDRFRGRCLAGTKDFPEDGSPCWVRQDGNLDNSAEKTQPEGETNTTKVAIPVSTVKTVLKLHIRDWEKVDEIIKFLTEQATIC